MQSKGIWVAFKPDHDVDGTLQAFGIYILQKLGQPVHVSYRYHEGETSKYARKFQLEENEKILLHSIEFDRLNESPWLSFRFWLTEKREGKAAQFDVDLKPKPKSFFKKQQMVEWLNSESYLYELLPGIPKDKSLNKEDLAIFKRSFKRKKSASHHQFLLEKANMPDFIDLHAEKIFKSTKDKTNHEILTVQLKVFEDYLDKAVYHNLDRIYVVHGYGKGKLRDEIHQILEEYPHVVSYNNDYTPRFGNGATEVIFG